MGRINSTPRVNYKLFKGLLTRESGDAAGTASYLNQPCSLQGMRPDLRGLEQLLLELFDTLLPDLLLSFAFFAALSYGVLGRRLGTGRPAAAVSAAVGLALSAALVGWEYARGYRLADLGPIAAGFLILALGAVVFQSLRRIGGGLAGAALSLGGCILAAGLLDLPLPGGEGLQALAILILLLGAAIAYLRGRSPAGGQETRSTISPDDLRELAADEGLSRQLTGQMDYLRRRLRDDAQGEDEDLDRQTHEALQRMLPKEGWLTERLAEFRRKVHHLRQGHLSQIEQLQKHLRDLPPPARRQAAERIKIYAREVQLGRRLERLDRAVAETERRIRDLTRRAGVAMARHRHREVVSLVEEARKLQSHITQLLRRIARTEQNLLGEAAKTTTAEKRS
ncbi:MAG: hypothetical protein ACOC93_00010 [Planctomycetota bacterium]